MLLVVLALVVLVVARADGLASAMEPGTLAQQRPSVGSVRRNYRNVPEMKTDDNDIELVWSDPVLVEDFAYRLPVPDHFYVFDDNRHMFGVGFNGSWMFSSTAGKQWQHTTSPSNVPHEPNAMIAVRQHSLRTLGGGIYPLDINGWQVRHPRVYSLLPDGSGFSIKLAEKVNVTFRGVPYPGVNISAQALVKSGTRNYGIQRAANGRYVLQTDVLWNGLPEYTTHGTTFAMISIVSFTSIDTYDWSFGGVIANYSSVGPGNLTDPAPGDVRNPLMWGPSEIDLTLLADNKTLLSVVRMDGDSGCFSGDVPPQDRDAHHTTYRNYAASFSTDNGVSWSPPKSIEGTGCARPRLKKLDSGVLFLTGGRLCVENRTGIFLWVDKTGLGGFGSSKAGTETWVRHSITAQHNRLWKGDAKYLFTEMVNDSSVFETLSYTSIMATGPKSAVITYNKFQYEEIGKNGMGWPGPNANFAMSVSLA